ncbi:hypothetical protein OROMI_025485 [Orobanche minor]
MAEEGYSYESRFVCKLCNKRFTCGKSLGGHMRSHISVANSAESEEMSDKKTSTFDDFGDGQQQQSSYVLRENPKKTWRAVDHPRIPSPHDKICKQCGKGFQSMKALCGHMACHSDRDRNVKDDGSWTSESRKAAVGDSCSDTEEGEERRMRTRSSLSSKYKRYKKFVQKSPCFTLSSNNTNNMNGFSSVSEIDGQDQEDVAMCLMLLSRDFGNNNNNNHNSVVESSDNNSVVLETKSSSIEMRIGKVEKLNNIHKLYEEKIGNMKLKGKILGGETTTQVGDFDSDSDSGYFLGECAKADSDLSVYGFRKFKNEDYGVGLEKSLKVIKNELRKKMSKDDVCGDTNGTASDFAVIESRERKYYISEDPDEFRDSSRKKKSKYECYNCKRTFKSYQALGGHRPCHKRTSAFYEPAYESGENSLDESTDYDKKKPSGKKIKASKNKGHVCPFCDRVFKNGQALGGHKRSHFIGAGRVENYNQSHVVKMDGRDLLDLNLPAPEDDGDNGHGKFDF